MLKTLCAILFILGLSACINSSFSYPPERFQSIDSATYAELTTHSLSDKGDRTTFGPKIAYSMGSYGGLALVQKANGALVYKFYTRIEYLDDYARNYDTVTNISGTKLPSTSTGGREGNGGYRVEFVNVNLPIEVLREARNDGLFLTIAAKGHERASARRRSTGFDLNEALRLANEVNGGSSPEYKSNDNFEVEVPAGYINKFLELIKQ